MFLACQKSKVTIKLKFYHSNLKNAVETVKIAVDSCYVLRQFLTPLPSIDFREIRGLVTTYTRILWKLVWHDVITKEFTGSIIVTTKVWGETCDGM
jgi:hypothetical protein